MDVRKVFAGILCPMVAMTSVPLGCGGTREQYVIRALPSYELPKATQRHALIPRQTHDQLQECFRRRAGPWPESVYAVQFDARADDQGRMLDVKLRDTTLRDTEVEGCFQQTIAAMVVPGDLLQLRSSRPVSEGESVKREQRGALGSSDSENPLLILGPIVVETLGTEVLIEVGLMIVAAVATIVDPPEQDPEQICQDRYMDCLLTDMAAKKGHKYDHSRCQWCREACIRGKGVWPSRTEGATGKSCEYWRRGK